MARGRWPWTPESSAPLQAHPSPRSGVNWMWWSSLPPSFRFAGPTISPYSNKLAALSRPKISSRLPLHCPLGIGDRSQVLSPKDKIMCSCPD